MFDSDGLKATTIAQLERYLQPGEKLLVAERIRRETTSAEWIGLLCGAPVLGLIGAVAGSLIGRAVAEQKDVGSVAHGSRCDDGFDSAATRNGGSHYRRGPCGWTAR